MGLVALILAQDFNYNMVDITLKIDLDSIIDEMDDLFKRQVPFAAHLALNESVFKGARDVKKALPYFIEGGPVPFTARGVQYRRSKSKRDLTASIFIPDAQWKYMRWIVDGGRKQWNKSQHGIGKPLYANVRFNKYGNIPGRRRKEKVWRTMLNQLGGTSGPPQGKLGKNEFVGEVNGITGLWKRLGKGGRANLQLLVKFDHDPVHYGKGRFPFQKFSIKFVTKSFPRNFNKRLTEIVNRESKNLKVR